MKKCFYLIVGMMFLGIPAYSSTNPKAKDITVNAAVFNKNLNSSDTTVQAALQTIDQGSFSGGGGTWGSITGLISNQADLQTALNAKQNSIQLGTSLQYLRGDLSLATFPTNLSSFTNGPGYITGNQNITLSGDVSGSGATAITATLPTVNSNIGTFQGITVNAKGLVTAAANQNYITGNQTITLSGPVTGSGATSIATTIGSQAIQSSNVNWPSISSAINASALNWPNINLSGLIANGGINWTDITKGSENTTGINWAGAPGNANGNIWTSTGTGGNWQSFSAVQVYPGSGIANSTGSSWGTSYSTTGSGTVVALATSPSLTTPSLGAATASSINKLAITTPATGSTLTIANGKTLTANNTLVLNGTDGTTMTFPTTSATLARTDASNTFTGHQTIEGVTSTGATGTGNFVFSVSPTLTTPNLGAATATSINMTGATALRPAIFDLSKNLVSGLYSGNTNVVVTSNGALNPGDCVKIDTNGNYVDAGAACNSAIGTGTVTSVSLASPNSTLQSVGGTNPVTISGTLNADVNWTDINGIGMLKMGGINWNDAKSLNQNVNWTNVNLITNSASTKGSGTGTIQLWNSASTQYVNWTTNSGLNTSYNIKWPSNAPAASSIPEIMDSLGDVNWVAISGVIGGASNWNQLGGNPNTINWQQWPNTFSGANGINWNSMPLYTQGINWGSTMSTPQITANGSGSNTFGSSIVLSTGSLTLPITGSTQCLHVNSSGVVSGIGSDCGSGGGGSPGGSNTQVQYNSSGSFAGSSNFVFNGTNVGIGTSSAKSALTVAGHIHTHGPTPTISSCGSSYGFGAPSSDQWGAVRVGTSGITSCVINFGTTWTNNPYCTANDDSNFVLIEASVSTTQLTLTGQSSISGDVISWVCGGGE